MLTSVPFPLLLSQLRKYRAVCTVEFLRTTWEKTNNPFIRLITFHTRPKLGIKKRIVLPRPSGSPYSRPVIGWLYFDGSESDLALCRNLILDIPGGGFVCMDPTHHDERLHHWAKRKGCAVLALDYSKAPGELSPSSSQIKREATLQADHKQNHPCTRVSISICCARVFRCLSPTTRYERISCRH
jgi:acetyl esterase/lipase